MLKAIVNYSKKVPVEGREYSSQGYSLSLETEIPETDPSAIQEHLHGTFELVKSSVEQELASGGSSAPEAGPGNRSRPGDDGRKASNRQIKYLNDLAAGQGIGVRQLNARLREKYGVSGPYELTRRQASETIDALQGNGRKAA